MKAAPVLPVYRTERQLAFNSKVERAASSPNGSHLIWRIKDSAFADRVHKLWRICTTTADGSLSETFKLDTDQTSGSGLSSGKLGAKTGSTGDSDSFVDAIVVDNDETHTEDKDIPPVYHSDGSSLRSGNGGSTSTTHRFDLRGDSKHYQGGLKSWIQYRGWPQVVEFFEPRFSEHEEDYQAQTWRSGKLLAFSASLFLILNWVLYLILNNDSTKNSLYAQIAFWGGLTLFTLPTPFMVALDIPRRSPILFQTWFCAAVWYCAFAEVIQMRQCRFFTENHCFSKNFLSTSYYFSGLPALMMFIVTKRLYNFIAQVALFVLLVALTLPVQAIDARNVVNFVIFSIFMQGLQYSSEKSRRKLFLLALQLKQALKSKHKARLGESKAYFNKRRFANYIFHEVRVPLNNALLAFQLLQSSNAFRSEFANGTETYALEQGLKMIKTVLNDVLDFEKMDSGNFETTALPFPLHQSIRNILDQVEVQASARQLVLSRSLDERIDAVPLSDRKMDEPEGLWVLGSELRLAQVLTNLAANAVKYTPHAGGPIRISTEFLGVSTRDELPGNPPDLEQDHYQSLEMTTDGYEVPGLTRKGTSRTTGGQAQTQCLNFRLVVHDSGPGIKPSDFVEDKLFQPFSQVTSPKCPLFILFADHCRAIGSGSGLGLAIVKQIVRLSGGRLGVTSRRGEGAKFWVELSYPIASAAEIQAARDANNLAALLPGYGPRDTFSGFIDKPLMASTPETTDTSSTDVTPVKVRPPKPPMSIPLSDLERVLPPVEPLTPLVPVVPAADPLLVLVVDDDALTRALYSKLLTKLGCVVHTAENGRECVDMVLGIDHTYDMVCLDNFMPVMTGDAAVKEIRSNGRDDFVVGCTGNALTEDQIKYRESGVDDVVVKPVMIHDFKRLIQLAHQRRLEKRAQVP
ncbi:Histidine kinase domain-containing protein [Mycena venus]|uniref:histidine kinase n=1 Tax=Mycena venus TaxID=2733690 RepID=A0A8H6YP65_9AGAR|nr:Histidine kinase domain-containing protein [Mycena venus]